MVAGRDFGVAVYPEFLREGSALADYRDPAKVVIAATDGRAFDAVEELAKSLPPAPVRVDFTTAEIVKYVDNSWHALKVAFANEVGRFAKAVGVDGHDVMDLFVRDTKLNISPSYLRPGFAFGGSCLPKDLRAFGHAARSNDLDLPILTNVLASNDRHVAQALEMVVATGARRVGILGLSFKQGTDDLREAPMVELTERLIGKGFDVRICDPAVRFASLHGANADYISNHIPAHLEPHRGVGRCGARARRCDRPRDGPPGVRRSCGADRGSAPPRRSGSARRATIERNVRWHRLVGEFSSSSRTCPCHSIAACGWRRRRWRRRATR